MKILKEINEESLYYVSTYNKEMACACDNFPQCACDHSGTAEPDGCGCDNS